MSHYTIEPDICGYGDQPIGTHIDYPDAVYILQQDTARPGMLDSFCPVRKLSGRSAPSDGVRYHLVVEVCIDEPVDGRSPLFSRSAGLNLNREEAAALVHSLALFLERTADE